MTILDDRAAKAIQEAMDARVRALSANHPTTHMAEVIEIDQAGVTWVHIFGGADRTPAIRSLAQVKKGDLVTVTIEDGVVTINGSSSNPAASVEYVEAADYAIAEYAKQAMAAVLGDVLQVKEAIIERATIEDLTAVEATVQTLTASYANLNEIVAGKATIVDLNAATARISQLEADDVTINGKITAAEGRIGTIESDYLKTTDMDAEVARVGTLLTGYAEADLANVNNAWIQNGVIKDAAITNEMVGSLSANKLTAGTINGANINVTNLNADNITTGTINGQRIGQGSLSLDKLAEDVYTESEVDAIVDGLNDRIDGAIETHTGTVVPTLNNSPASSWNTTDLKDEHIGDVYYVVNSQSQQNGYCYRFTKTGNTYSWQLIKDSDVTAALSRLETAEGKITTFDSDISTLKTDTGVLKTKTQTLETSLGDKVDTSTFNELSSTVDENSSTITSMSTVLTNNGLTSSTNITNTVNTVSQTASSNSSVISQLASTLGTNADGTTKAGDIVHRTSAVEQDLSTFKTTVSSTYATQTSVENAQADATKALNRQTAYFATSSTGATTTAKTASSSNFPTLVAGVTVTVRFSTANTSTSAITLNVNSTGAKTIYVNGATTASGNQLLWSANANITFTYDGTYWRMVSEPRTWYGTCSTAAGTAAKTSTINEIVVCKGTVVKLNMTYANTNTSATMNITSTGAKNLYYGTSTTRPTTANGYGWGASSTATFVFDGQYWRVGDTSVVARLIQAESTISSHTTSIEQNATNIALKANSSEVYTKTQTDGLISTEVTNRNAAITAASNSITASVEETYATKTALADGLEDANDYTDSEISSAKAEIKVTTDGISSEVSNKVGSSEIISKINQSAETVKIQASKVEIDGTAIFNSISSNVDSAITSKGYQTSSQVESAISTAVDNINVGGRNLVGFSADYRNWSKSANVTFDNDVVDINVSGQTSNQFKRAHGYLTESNLVDGTYTLSFEVYCDDWSAVTSDKAAGYTSACLQMCYYDCDKWSSPTNVKRYRYNSLGLAENWSVQPTQENGKWLKFVSVPITLPDSFTNDVNKGTAREIVVEPMLRRNGHVRFRKIKFERSNVATDWTPAPEDLALASTGVYYATCSTAAGTAVKVATTEQSGFTLVSGAMVNVKFTATNSAAVADLKLNVDGTGEKPIKYIYNNSLNNLPGVGYLLANNVYTFRYDGTNWVAQLMYNTDTQSRTRWQNVIKAAAAITNGYIICGTASGYRNVAAGVTFDLSYPLLYCATTKAAGETSDNNFLQINGIKITNNGTVTSAANYKTVYLVGTVSGNTFTVKASPFMTTVEPTSEDGFFYIPLGVFYNSTTNIYFNSSKDLYAFLDGEFRQATPTEVVAVQTIYIQSNSVQNVPLPTTSWIEDAGESVVEDEGQRTNLLTGDSLPGNWTVNAPSGANYTATSLDSGRSVRVAFDTVSGYEVLNSPAITVENGTEYTLSCDYIVGKTYNRNGSYVYGVTVRTDSGTHGSYDTSSNSIAKAEFQKDAGMYRSTVTFTPTVTTIYLALNGGNIADSQTDLSFDVMNMILAKGGSVPDPIWTIKPPTYRSTYPITFVATQRKRMDGTVTCTTPVMDDTTTIIDGGHIVTGTLDANRVNVINLNASNISSGYLEADRIKSGSISVSMFSDDVSSTFALSENVEQSFRDVGTSLTGMNNDLSGQISAVSANAQAANSTATAASSIANSLNDTVNGTSTSPGLVDRMGNVESRVNITTIGEGDSSQPAIILDASGGQSEGMAAVLTNTALSFTDQGTVVSYISNRKQYITDLEVTGEAQLGNFAFIPMSDESLAFKWVSSAIISPNISLYTPTDYCAYQIPLYKALQPEVTYRIDLYDVDVSHAGRTAAELGVGVWYCGATICLGIWKGTAAFSNGHADHLSMVFTPHMDSSATVSGTGALMPDEDTSSMSHSTATSANPPYIRLYNSFPNADGAKNMVVGSWDISIESE